MRREGMLKQVLQLQRRYKYKKAFLLMAIWMAGCIPVSVWLGSLSSAGYRDQKAVKPRKSPGASAPSQYNARKYLHLINSSLWYNDAVLNSVSFVAFAPKVGKKCTCRGTSAIPKHVSSRLR